MTDTQQQIGNVLPGVVSAAIQAAPQIAVAAEPPGELVATGSPKLDSAHTDFAEFHEGYVSRYIDLADTKAALALTIASGSIAYIFGNERLQELFRHPSLTILFGLSILTITLLAISAFFAFLVIAPRLGGSSEGIVYFGSVARRESADDYVNEIASKNEAQLTEARLKHSYDISRICVRKYKHFQKAIFVGVPGLIGLAMMLFLK